MDGDYIKTLSNDEKLAFLRIFCAMVRADGTVDAEEISFLKEISLRYGIDNATVIDIIKNHQVRIEDIVHGIIEVFTFFIEIILGRLYKPWHEYE